MDDECSAQIQIRRRRVMDGGGRLEDAEAAPPLQPRKVFLIPHSDMVNNKRGNKGEKGEDVSG